MSNFHINNILFMKSSTEKAESKRVQTAIMLSHKPNREVYTSEHYIANKK